MALAAMDSAAAAFSIISSSYPSISPKFNSFNKPLSSSISLKSAHRKFPLLSIPHPIIKRPGALFCVVQTAVETVVVEETLEKSPKIDNKRKLFVLNLPWSYSVVDIKNMFGECGIVADVEIIKQKDGKNRGFAFVTMASGEGAQAAIEKFDSFQVAGRIIKVQFAKRFKRPPPPAPTPPPPPQETRHKLYVSNLAWKVRTNNLRELFVANSNPVSARVIFDSGRSAGYGFVSFATKEEADSAIIEFDGKELFGRQIRVKLSEKNDDESEGKKEESSELQVESESKESESKEEESNEIQPEDS